MPDPRPSEAAPEMAQLEIRKGPDAAVEAGGLRFVACRREVGEIDGGVTLYVWSAGEDARELLRFDLFRNRPHYHAPAANQKETAIADAGGDALGWGVDALSTRAPAFIREAGEDAIAASLDADALAAARPALARLLAGLGEPTEVSWFEVPRSVLESLDRA